MPKLDSIQLFEQTCFLRVDHGRMSGLSANSILVKSREMYYPMSVNILFLLTALEKILMLLKGPCLKDFKGKLITLKRGQK